MIIALRRIRNVVVAVVGALLAAVLVLGTQLLAVAFSPMTPCGDMRRAKATADIRGIADALAEFRRTDPLHRFAPQPVSRSPVVFGEDLCGRPGLDGPPTLFEGSLTSAAAMGAAPTQPSFKRVGAWGLVILVAACLLLYAAYLLLGFSIAFLFLCVTFVTYVIAVILTTLLPEVVKSIERLNELLPECDNVAPSHVRAWTVGVGAAVVAAALVALFVACHPLSMRFILFGILLLLINALRAAFYLLPSKQQASTRRQRRLAFWDDINELGDHTAFLKVSGVSLAFLLAGLIVGLGGLMP